MYIEKINIASFGRLHNFELNLSSGMNIIEGSNESGKSTIAAFIKYMFYGFTPKERSAYLSWDTGGVGGTLTVDTGVRRYRIERAMISNGDDEKQSFRETVKMVDLSNNMPCHKGESPGELFFGVDAEMFASTAFVSQLGGASVSGGRVYEGIENLLFSADETVNTQRALSKLDAARVLLLHKNEKGGRIFELDSEIASLEARLSAALKSSNDILAKEAQLSDVRRNEALTAKQGDELSTKLEQFETRTIVGLFNRMHKLEQRVAELHEKIQKTASPESERLENLRKMISQISQLKAQIKELDERSSKPTGEPSEELLEYIELGGREGYDERCELLRSKVRIKTAVAILLTIFGIIGIAVGLFPLLIHTQPMMWGVVFGIILLSVAATLYSLGVVSLKQLRRLEESFDVELLDSERSRLERDKESAKFVVLARDDLNSRLSEQLAAAEREYGSADQLENKLGELIENEKETEALRTEEDKYLSLIASIREQLKGYDENELTQKFDDDIDVSDIDSTNLSAIRKKCEFLRRSRVELGKCAAELDRELAGLYPTAEDPKKLSDKLNCARLERDELSLKLEGLLLAEEKLLEASGRLRESVAPRLAKEAGKLLEGVTEGKYGELGVGGNLELYCATDSGQKEISQLSAGTQDAAYLALRISLCRLVYRQSKPPMIYDESFARLDNARAKKMLELAAVAEQCIVMTTTDREAELYPKANRIKI